MTEPKDDAAPQGGYQALCAEVAKIIDGKQAGDVIAMCCETLLWTLCKSATNKDAAHTRFIQIIEAMHDQIEKEYDKINNTSASKPH